jgi:hypothetical protein
LTPAPPVLKSAPTSVLPTTEPQIGPTCDYKPVITSTVIEPAPAPVHLLKARFSSNSSVDTPTPPKTSNSNQGSNINGEDFNARKETPTPVSKPELTHSSTAPLVFKPAPTSAVTTTAAFLNSTGQTFDPASDPVLDHSVLDHPVLDRPVLDHPLDPPMLDLTVLDHPVLDHSVLDHQFLDHSELDHPMLFDSNGQPLNPVLDHLVLDHPVSDHPVLDHPNLNHPLDHPMLDLTVLDHPILDHPVLGHPVLDHPVLDHPVLDHQFLDHSELDHPVLFDRNGQPLNLASIPLPPSVASALESINERVAMRQRKNQIMVISQIFSSKYFFFFFHPCVFLSQHVLPLSSAHARKIEDEKQLNRYRDLIAKRAK